MVIPQTFYLYTRELYLVAVVGLAFGWEVGRNDKKERSVIIEVDEQKAVQSYQV